MEKIRIGNDIEVLWAIYAGEGINEAPYDLTGRNLSLYMNGSFGRIPLEGVTTEGHILRCMFWGKDQMYLGKYSLELVENEGLEGMHTVDECDAFQLVRCSCETDNNPEGRLECIHLQFRGSISVGFPTIGGESIVIDSALSTTSTNPVQNKVVTKAINELNEKVDGFDSGIQEAVSAANAAQTEVGIMKGQVEELNTKVDEIIGNILFPTVNPTFTAPSASISLVGYVSVKEVGAEAPKLENFSTSFNAGQIMLGGEKQNNRAGDLDTDKSFVYIGDDPTNRVPSDSVLTTIGEGNIEYTYRAFYNEGPQPVDNNGNKYSTPLAAGYVDSAAVLVNGTWPWYASTASASAENPVVKQSLVSWSSILGAMSTGKFTVQPSGTLPQVFKLPRPLVALQMLNTISGQMNTIGTTDYTESTEVINGRTYYIYIYNGAARGSVTLLATF